VKQINRRNEQHQTHRDNKIFILADLESGADKREKRAASHTQVFTLADIDSEADKWEKRAASNAQGSTKVFG